MNLKYNATDSLKPFDNKEPDISFFHDLFVDYNPTECYFHRRLFLSISYNNKQKKIETKMWTHVKSYKLPMGDMFLIERNHKQLRSIIQKNGEHRVSCTTNSMRTIKEYFHIKCLAEKDCLEGLSPYISRTYSQSYKNNNNK